MFGESKRRPRSCQLKKINVITTNIPLPDFENQTAHWFVQKGSPRKSHRETFKKLGYAALLPKTPQEKAWLATGNKSAF